MTTTQIQDVIEHEIGAQGKVRIRGAEGRVDLRAVDAPSVRVLGSGERPLDEDFTVRLGHDALELSAIDSGPLGLGRICQAIVVEVPRGARVVVETTSGQVHSMGLSGDQRYQTLSADIGVDAGAGRIDAQTVSGDIRLDAPGELSANAQTVSGELSIEANSIGSLRARTTSGSARIDGTFDGPGPFTVETVSGDVTISTTGPVRVEGSTVSGDVRSSLPHRSDGRPGRRSIELGVGGPVIGFRSISGGLEVVADQPTHAPEPARKPRTDTTDTTDALRLAILRDVESGAIDIDEAERRLNTLEASAPAGRPVGAADQIPPAQRPEPDADFGWVRRV